MFRKTKAPRASTKDELLDLCKNELQCSACALVPGPTTEVVYQTLPPPDTIAIIVDISPSGGAMKVGQKSDNDLGVGVVGKVGTEDADALVIVPWNNEWSFYSIGSIAMQYVVRT